MVQTASIANYNRADMAAMLSALPREEQQWTWNFLNNIIFVTTTPKAKKPVQMKQGTSLSVTPFVASLSAHISTSTCTNEKEEYHKRNTDETATVYCLS